MGKSTVEKPIITILGDSTIDNKVWVSPGLVGNVILDHLHLSTALRNLRRLFHYPHSVVENLRLLYPEYEVQDYSNDGFTTGDVLGLPENNEGAFKDKVFGEVALGPLHFKPYPNLYPHTHFKPLEAGKEAIQKSKHIILSIGGNNFREFLRRVVGLPEEYQETYIKDNFEAVFTNMRQEYLEIVRQIRVLNKDAKIILMTQYYPSMSQDHYGIYPFMHELGRILNIGKPPYDPKDVIHEIMQKTYREILQQIPKENVVVADVTSSLNPYDSDNHVRQIEPGDDGGRKIAQMLSHAIEHDPGHVYSFLPDFFIGNGHANVTTAFNQWLPKHPTLLPCLKNNTCQFQQKNNHPST